MENASVSVRGKAAPLVALLATVVVVLLVAPMAVNQIAGPELAKAVKKTASIEGEPVYRDYAHAADLLKAGDIDGARKIVDSQQEASLAALNTQATAGPLSNLSATALLWNLGKAMSRQAVRVAWEGDEASATAWIGRCRMLSNQALVSPIPTLEGLQLAGAMDRLALETEASVRFALGDPVGATLHSRRLEAFDNYWKRDILTTVTQKREQWGYQRFPINGKLPPTEALDNAERKLAADMTARYLGIRRRMQFS